MRHKHSDYMHWSKTQSRARFNLATSGVAPFPLRELPVDLEKLEINGDNSYGYAPLQQAIAATTALIPIASWNLPARRWRIISPWLRSSSPATKF